MTTRKWLSFPRMTILWIYNEPFNPEVGGTERITSLIMKGLSNVGHQCLGMLVFDKQTFEISFDGRPIHDLYEFLSENHVAVVINQVAYNTALLNHFLQKGGQNWKTEGGHIISCLHFDPKMPSLRTLYRCSPSKSLHDWLTLAKLTIFNAYYEKMQDRQMGAIYREVYEKSDYFVALSKCHFPYLKQVMQLDCYDKLVAIGNPLTFDDISDEGILEKKENVCLIVARMSEYHKRISLALRVWTLVQKHQEAKSWTLKIVGDGPDLSYYKEYVRQHRILHVEFLGQRSPEPYYREAKIYLMTSSAEGWGLSLTESLQRGVVPVVMDSSPVFREIIEDGINGIITSNGDVSTMVQAVLQLIRDKKSRTKMAQCALQRAHSFTLEFTINKWEQLLNA